MSLKLEAVTWQEPAVVSLQISFGHGFPRLPFYDPTTAAGGRNGDAFSILSSLTRSESTWCRYQQPIQGPSPGYASLIHVIQSSIYSSD